MDVNEEEIFVFAKNQTGAAKSSFENLVRRKNREI
jgi:hypothetical protein